MEQARDRIFVHLPQSPPIKTITLETSVMYEILTIDYNLVVIA